MTVHQAILQFALVQKNQSWLHFNRKSKQNAFSESANYSTCIQHVRSNSV